MEWYKIVVIGFWSLLYLWWSWVVIRRLCMSHLYEHDSTGTWIGVTTIVAIIGSAIAFIV